MQYSVMSPVSLYWSIQWLCELKSFFQPPLSLDHNYPIVSPSSHHINGSDNESPTNEVSSSSDISNQLSPELDQLSISRTNFDGLNGAETITTMQASINESSSVRPFSTLSLHVSGMDDLESNSHVSTANDSSDSRRHPIVQEPPAWIPDHLAPRCMACGAMFNMVRRRHHCRNCGKVFMFRHFSRI